MRDDMHYTMKEDETTTFDPVNEASDGVTVIVSRDVLADLGNGSISVSINRHSEDTDEEEEEETA